MSNNSTQSQIRKIILITGASKGIGKAIAKKLGKKNIVILIARNLDLLKRVETSINSINGQSSIIQTDITNESDVKNCVQQVIEKYGTIDVLINNAGIGKFNRIDKFSLQDYHDVFNVNVLGTFLFIKHVVPIMIAKKSGQIINISSIAGLTGFKTGTLYSASKFAINGLTESLREDVKGFGIAVSAICPGSVNTTFGNSSPGDKSDRDYLLEPEDVARTVNYLVNESETSNTKLIELKPRRRKKFR